jgi:nicotinate-nucleotide pyrophosphorylase (carboxylating)
VRCGGGRNHRFGLDDGILVKDNHLRAAGGVRPAVELLRAAGSGLPIEVEAETLDDVREAVAAGAEQILLDNMSPALMREAVQLVAARRRSRPRAASRSRPCARSPPPESTSSRSAR